MQKIWLAIARVGSASGISEKSTKLRKSLTCEASSMSSDAMEGVSKETDDKPDDKIGDDKVSIIEDDSMLAK